MTQQTAAPVLAHDGDGIQGLVALLSLEEKVSLLTGKTVWRLHDIPRIGLRSVAMSDGPVGVRGLGETPGETSALFPSPSAIGATWDVELAGEVGRAFAREARTHGVDVVLAPQVNIQRTPVGGRHFECYSEDPLLTSVIGATWTPSSTLLYAAITDQAPALTACSNGARYTSRIACWSTRAT